MENPTNFPDFILDAELIADVTRAIMRARERKTHDIKIFGTLVGATIIQAKLAGATLRDTIESFELGWTGPKS